MMVQHNVIIIFFWRRNQKHTVRRQREESGFTLRADEIINIDRHWFEETIEQKQNKGL